MRPAFFFCSNELYFLCFVLYIALSDYSEGAIFSSVPSGGAFEHQNSY